MDEFSDFVQSPTVGGGEQQQQQQQQQDEDDDFLARERKAMEEAGLGLKDMGIVNIYTHTSHTYQFKETETLIHKGNIG